MSPAAPWVSHFGLKRTPFGKGIAAKDLFSRQAHEEAVARINFCIVESRSRCCHRRRRRRKDGRGQSSGVVTRPDQTPGDLYRQPRLRHPGPVRHDRKGARGRAEIRKSRAHGPSSRSSRSRRRRKTPPGGDDLSTRLICSAPPS